MIRVHYRAIIATIVNFLDLDIQEEHDEYGIALYTKVKSNQVYLFNLNYLQLYYKKIYHN